MNNLLKSLNTYIWQVTVCLTLSISTLAGQGLANHHFGTKSLSLGGISAVLFDVDAVHNNFSNVLFTESSQAVSFHSAQRFSLSELTTSSLGYHRRFDNNNAIGLSLRHYGFEEYREQGLSCAYAKQLSQKLSISANFDFTQIVVKESGSKSFFTFGLGLSGVYNDKLSYGVYIQNPLQLYNNEFAHVTSFLNVGIKNQVSDAVILYLEVSKYVSEKVNVLAGLEYRYKQNIGFRMGVNSNPGTPAFGFFYRYKKLTLDLGSSYMTSLGVTPSLSLNIKFNPASGHIERVTRYER